MTTHPIPIGTPVLCVDDDGTALAGSKVVKAIQIPTSGAWLYEVDGYWDVKRWPYSDIILDTPETRACRFRVVER